jgi:hypothetical protein
MYFIAFGVLVFVSVFLFPVATPQNGTRKNILRIAKILLGAVGTIAVGRGVYLMLFFSLTGDSQDKVVMEQHSPNDAYVAREALI